MDKREKKEDLNLHARSLENPTTAQNEQFNKAAIASGRAYVFACCLCGYMAIVFVANLVFVIAIVR